MGVVSVVVGFDF
ncbi:TPA: hypothetical protein V0D87_001559 [Streptococcus pneumoniae]|nr:hypothetical protein [Streptococcus pneumoniae]HEW5005157.1 hypothetical protein [Streptococcus pneumoniae]